MFTFRSLMRELVELPIALLLPPTPSRSVIDWLLPRRQRRQEHRLERRIHEGRFQRALSVIAGMSGLLAGLEVTLQHYRGSYNQRIMYSPVLLSAPLFVAGMGGAKSRRVARTMLPIASLAMLGDGLLGFGFHVRGIARKPGGFRIPVFNIVMGPPIFAPLLLGIGGFLGVVASLLRREDDPPTSAPTSWSWKRAHRHAVSHYWSLLVQDGVAAYYAHPFAWDEIGFGGPAYPRGYMRLENGSPEPWEVDEARYEWVAPEGSLSDSYRPLEGDVQDETSGGHHGQGGTH